MEIYKIPIEVAFLVFPFIAFVLTIPFLIYQYNKYGAIPMIKSIVFYSLILYLITAYFMVILPLPSIETVSKISEIPLQLTPFNFIKEIKATTSFNINDINSLLNFLNKPTVYTVVFNVLLTIPFGFYLKYFFNKKWYQAIIYSFFLSLFFELTQLSGLYGIYPKPYRLFDVDDLIINTFGGLLGYVLAPILELFLPSREELENKSYQKGQKVTIIRRGMALLIDLLFITMLSICIKIFSYNTNFENYSYFLSITLYYLVFSLFTQGKTIGKKIVKLKITSIEGKMKCYNVIARNVLLIYFILFPYITIGILKENLTIPHSNYIVIIVSIMIILFQIINLLYYIFKRTNNKSLFLYEKLTNTQNVSTIEVKVLEKDTKEKEIKKIKLSQNNVKNKKSCYNEENEY